MLMTYRLSQLQKKNKLTEQEFLKELTNILDKNKCRYICHSIMPMKSLFIVVKKDTNVYKGLIIAGFIFGSLNHFGIETFTLKGE